MALAGQVELGSCKFSAGGIFPCRQKNVPRRRNTLYFLVLLESSVDILVWKSAISVWGTKSDFSVRGNGPSSFLGSIMNSWARIRNVAQAAPLLLVADALLTLLTVQVASLEVSKFLHEVSFFATIVLQQFFFADGSTLQYWLPVLHAAGGQTNRCQTQ